MFYQQGLFDRFMLLLLFESEFIFQLNYNWEQSTNYLLLQR